jgi:HAMP domain-containing protein
MNREIEDNSKALRTLGEEFDDVEMRMTDVEMSLQGAHFMISPMKDEVGSLKGEVRDLNDIIANFSN